MIVLKKVKSHQDVINYFKELLFCNTFIEKPNIKRLKNNNLLSEFPFYEELNVIKTDHAFKRYVLSCKFQLVEKKYSLIQLEKSESALRLVQGFPK